jgi:hypothetical protein
MAQMRRNTGYVQQLCLRVWLQVSATVGSMLVKLSCSWYDRTGHVGISKVHHNKTLTSSFHFCHI